MSNGGKQRRNEERGEQDDLGPKSASELVNDLQGSIDDFNIGQGIESFNSDVLSTIEFKVPGGLRGEFVYKTFRVDETVNDTGRNNKIRKVSDSAVFDDIRLREDPRYITLTWSKVNHPESVTVVGVNEKPQLNTPALSKVMIKKYIEQGLYNDLRNFSNGNFFNLIIQDTGMDGKLFTAISASFEIEKEKELEELHSKQQLSAFEIQQKLRQKFSALEQFRILNESKNKSSDSGVQESSETLQQNQDVEDRQILNILQGITNEYGSDLEQDDYIVLNKFSEEKKFLLAENFKNTAFDAVINNKFLYTISKTVSSDNLGIFSDEFQNFDETFKSIEDSKANDPVDSTYAQSVNERVITSIDDISATKGAPIHSFDNSRDPKKDNKKSKNIKFEKIILPKPSLRFIGYIIDKFYIDNDINRVDYDSITIPENDILSYKDNEIIYGVNYYYTVAQLAELLIPITDHRTGYIKIARILVKGKPSNAALVKSVERIPPLPPRDFFMCYSRSRKAMHLSWASATDSQKDITKYFIFKRMSIEEQFKLIGLIDFTPKNYKAPEKIKYKLDSSVKIINEPLETTNFFDEEFTFNITPIYAIIACDAHELYSNYSIQLQTKFDLLRNVITIQKISDANAPIPYPNFYVKKSVFEKAIFTKNVKNIKLVFNPDIIELEYIDEESSASLKSISVLAKELGERYKMNIINTDLGVSNTIDININETRIEGFGTLS